MLLAFLNKLLFDEMYHFALQASPGSWGQLARLGFNEESGEDHFSEFLQAGEALLEEGEHRRAASQVPPATAWRIRKYSFKRAEPSPPAAGISGVPPGALCGQGSVAPQPDLSDPPPIEGPEQLLTEAMRLFTQGKVSEAMFCLSRSLWIADSGEAAAVPSSLISILHSNRALERLQLQQWTGAEDDCTVAVTLNPRNAKAWYWRAEARLALGRVEEALMDVGLALQELTDKHHLEAAAALDGRIVEQRGRIASPRLREGASVAPAMEYLATSGPQVAVGEAESAELGVSTCLVQNLPQRPPQETAEVAAAALAPRAGRAPWGVVDISRRRPSHAEEAFDWGAELLEVIQRHSPPEKDLAALRLERGWARHPVAGPRLTSVLPPEASEPQVMALVQALRAVVASLSPERFGDVAQIHVAALWTPGPQVGAGGGYAQRSGGRPRGGDWRGSPVTAGGPELSSSADASGSPRRSQGDRATVALGRRAAGPLGLKPWKAQRCKLRSRWCWRRCCRDSPAYWTRSSDDVGPHTANWCGRCFRGGPRRGVLTPLPSVLEEEEEGGLVARGGLAGTSGEPWTDGMDASPERVVLGTEAMAARTGA